uniref:Uncharacterized protein n=1 Tax=Anopheles culicifacies TaxID=139723 RepID=A0A182LX05_9DIPT
MSVRLSLSSPHSIVDSVFEFCERIEGKILHVAGNRQAMYHSSIKHPRRQVPGEDEIQCRTRRKHRTSCDAHFKSKLQDYSAFDPALKVAHALLSGTLRTYQRAGCDRELVTLSCPRGTSISIEIAQYGRSGGE